jgi:hypothetical protein
MDHFQQETEHSRRRCSTLNFSGHPSFSPEVFLSYLVERVALPQGLKSRDQRR